MGIAPLYFWEMLNRVLLDIFITSPAGGGGAIHSPSDLRNHWTDSQNSNEKSQNDMKSDLQ